MDRGLIPYQQYTMNAPTHTNWNARVGVRPVSTEIMPRLVFNPRRSFPAYSLLVGACDDGLPLLLDMLNPTAGPVLVTGDSGCGKTALLQSICLSALQLNGPAEVRTIAITTQREEWRCLDRTRAYLVDARDSAAVIRVITELGALLEQRHESEQSNLVRAQPARHAATQGVILFLDDLTGLFEMDLSIQAQLYWLLEQGAVNRIWTFCSLETRRALNLHYWINLFRTRLLGKISRHSALQELAQHPGFHLDRTVEEGQFAFYSRKGWQRFWAVNAAGNHWRS